MPQPAFSNIKTQSASYDQQIKSIQEQALKIQENLNQTSKEGETAVAEKEPSIVDKITGFLGGKQDELAQAKSSEIPTLKDATNEFLLSLGYTPEVMATMADKNTQLASLNEQIAAVEEERGLAIANAEGRTGGTIAGFGAEASRINRLYSVRQSGLGAKASALSAEIATMQGAQEKAFEAAKDYVTLATQQQRQNVQDIQWAMQFYSTTLLAMDKAERDTFNDAFNQNMQVLTFEETKAQNEINNRINNAQLSISQQRLGLDERRITVDEYKAFQENTEASAQLGNNIKYSQ